jgi:flavin reductase (DIM6/NTAB) family NADH-FMN oxidoreductase RutF
MSYTQVVNHDPPIFCIGFSGGLDNAKDSLRNLYESKECRYNIDISKSLVSDRHDVGTINIISEHFIEAANATSINAPYGVSEWALTGLHPAPTNKVKAPRVAESVFSIEGKLLEIREFESKAKPGVKTGVLAIVEGTHFWVREDAINEERNQIDPAVSTRLPPITHPPWAYNFNKLCLDLGSQAHQSSWWDNVWSHYRRIRDTKARL